jgi:hypothetical protein
LFISQTGQRPGNIDEQQRHSAAFGRNQIVLGLAFRFENEDDDENEDEQENLAQNARLSGIALQR